jgi:hypothetical protein
MHGPHSAVMDCGVSDRRPPRQTAPIDVLSSQLTVKTATKTAFCND